MPCVTPVGMSQIKAGKAPEQFAVYGIGSCVILAVYDSERKIGGLAHIMLPDSAGMNMSEINPVKFADSAVPALIEAVLDQGAIRGSLEAKMFGGAEMFPPTEDYDNRIGRENIKAVKKALSILGIPVIKEDTGGTHGRSIEFDLSNGEVKMYIVGEEARIF